MSLVNLEEATRLQEESPSPFQSMLDLQCDNYRDWCESDGMGAPTPHLPPASPGKPSAQGHHLSGCRGQSQSWEAKKTPCSFCWCVCTSLCSGTGCPDCMARTTSTRSTAVQLQTTWRSGDGESVSGCMMPAGGMKAMISVTKTWTFQAGFPDANLEVYLFTRTKFHLEPGWKSSLQGFYPVSLKDQSAAEAILWILALRVHGNNARQFDWKHLTSASDMHWEQGETGRKTGERKSGLSRDVEEEENEVRMARRRIHIIFDKI